MVAVPKAEVLVQLLVVRRLEDRDVQSRGRDGDRLEDLDLQIQKRDRKALEMKSLGRDVDALDVQLGGRRIVDVLPQPEVESELALDHVEDEILDRLVDDLAEPLGQRPEGIDIAEQLVRRLQDLAIDLLQGAFRRRAQLADLPREAEHRQQILVREAVIGLVVVVGILEILQDGVDVGHAVLGIRARVAHYRIDDIRTVVLAFVVLEVASRPRVEETTRDSQAHLGPVLQSRVDVLDPVMQVRAGRRPEGGGERRGVLREHRLGRLAAGELTEQALGGGDDRPGDGLELVEKLVLVDQLLSLEQVVDPLDDRVHGPGQWLPEIGVGRRQGRVLRQLHQHRSQLENPVDERTARLSHHLVHVERPRRCARAEVRPLLERVVRVIGLDPPHAARQLARVRRQRHVRRCQRSTLRIRERHLPRLRMPDNVLHDDGHLRREESGQLRLDGGRVRVPVDRRGRVAADRQRVRPGAPIVGEVLRPVRGRLDDHGGLRLLDRHKGDVVHLVNREDVWEKGRPKLGFEPTLELRLPEVQVDHAGPVPRRWSHAEGLTGVFSDQGGCLRRQIGQIVDQGLVNEPDGRVQLEPRRAEVTHVAGGQPGTLHLVEAGPQTGRDGADLFDAVVPGRGVTHVRLDQEVPDDVRGRRLRMQQHVVERRPNSAVEIVDQCVGPEISGRVRGEAIRPRQDLQLLLRRIGVVRLGLPSHIE